MAEKRKMQLEYEIKSSPKILYSFISEPNGLAQWFADDVIYRDNKYHFVWDDETHPAKLLTARENKSVKFAWLDDTPYYLELEILQDELTNDVALAITDFAAEENEAERKLIWNNQIKYLLSVLGA
ncbi:START-like domain-containing protein [Olivibacter sp. CPCC 100613]|uniref:START-like domain-containing protein n=1 Tax=Olivibacter sp. CPCC 100613 TaxID=3079931 RepID=UPI002FFAEE1C